MSEPLPKDHRCNRCGEWYHNAHMCGTSLQNTTLKPAMNTTTRNGADLVALLQDIDAWRRVNSLPQKIAHSGSVGAWIVFCDELWNQRMPAALASFPQGGVPKSVHKETVMDQFLRDWEKVKRRPDAGNLHAFDGMLRMFIAEYNRVEGLATPASTTSDAQEATTDEMIELAEALERRRCIVIAQTVKTEEHRFEPKGQPTAFSAGFSLACEEIAHRIEHEEWVFNDAAIDAARLSPPAEGGKE